MAGNLQGTDCPYVGPRSTHRFRKVTEAILSIVWVVIRNLPMRNDPQKLVCFSSLLQVSRIRTSQPRDLGYPPDMGPLGIEPSLMECCTVAEMIRLLSMVVCPPNLAH